MRNLLLAGAAMLSLAAIQAPVMAQDMAVPGSQPPGDAMTPPADPAANPPADPAASPAMPAPSDPNAGQPTGAVPPETGPETGMVPAPAGMPRDPGAPVGSDANPVTVGGNMTPPPTETKDYPVCSRTVQDSCVNPGEARTMRQRR